MVGKNKAAGPPSAPTANLVREDVLLAPHTTLGVGGRARYFAECGSTAEVRDCLVWARERKLQVQVMGGGSNILFADEGFGGLVLKVALRGVAYADQGEWVLMRSGAGEDWDRLVRACIRRGLGGIECLSGIPGLVGATPVQNVGAYGQEVKETVVRVEAIERETLAEVAFTNAECGFSYRQSRFKSEDRDRHIITMVSFRLRARARACLRYPELQRHVGESVDLERLESGAPVLGAVRRAVLDLRRGKSMVLDPADPNARSAGSFFLNPVLSREEFGEFKERCIAAGCGGESARVRDLRRPQGGGGLAGGAGGLPQELSPRRGGNLLQPRPCPGQPGRGKLPRAGRTFRRYPAPGLREIRRPPRERAGGGRSIPVKAIPRRNRPVSRRRQGRRDWASTGPAYQYFIASSNRADNSSSPASRGDSLVTRCWGRVPCTRAGMSSGP